jgi:hypothetical protein
VVATDWLNGALNASAGRLPDFSSGVSGERHNSASYLRCPAQRLHPAAADCCWTRALVAATQ